MLECGLVWLTKWNSGTLRPFGRVSATGSGSCSIAVVAWPCKPLSWSETSSSIQLAIQAFPINTLPSALQAGSVLIPTSFYIYAESYKKIRVCLYISKSYPGKFYTMFSCLTSVVSFALASLMTMSIFDILTNDEGNLLPQSQKDIRMFRISRYKLTVYNQDTK